MSEISPVSVAIENQQQHGKTVFPYALFCQDSEASLADAVSWTNRQKTDLLNIANEHGAVLLRDFPIAGASDFDAIVSALELDNFPYKKSLSNAVRINRTDRVFSANEAPSEVRIFFHHEMAQTPLYPRWIFFSCEIAADQGGATPLCRSDVLYERIKETHPLFADACEGRGLRYTNVMPDDDDANSGMGRSWRSTLGADSRDAAEHRLAELGYSWQWQTNGCLKSTSPPLPAVMELPDGRKVFFNQLIAAFSGWKDNRNDPSKSIQHGDGTPVDPEAVLAATEMAEELAFDLQWQAGDIALIDNTIAMHARRPFQGKRKVVASLAEMQTQTFALNC
ncbi:MAG: TauD/TfdA family dioxygenase [Rubripirellula sp.]